MIRKKVLITGIKSLLGRYIVQVLTNRYELFGTVHKKNTISYVLPDEKIFPLQIQNKKEAIALVNLIKPDYVIHLAALSNIDYCQKHPMEAREINVQGTKNLLEATDIHTHFIFSSSNAVFSGKNAPYSETAEPHPLNVYGETKKIASKIVLNSKKRATVMRFTSMFGWPPEAARENDVTHYLKQLKKRNVLYLVNDRYFNPIYAKDAAKAILQVLIQGQTGIFHIGGQDRVTRFLFVKRIVEVFASKSRVSLKTVSSNFFPKIAPRPYDATLQTKKMEHVLKIKPASLLESLQRMSSESML